MFFILVLFFFFFFFNDTATTEIYTLSLHDALPIYAAGTCWPARCPSPPSWSSRTAAPRRPRRRRVRPASGRCCYQSRRTLDGSTGRRRCPPSRHSPGGRHTVIVVDVEAMRRADWPVEGGLH